MPSLSQLEKCDPYAMRHMEQNADNLAAMLHTVGASSLEALVSDTVPADIRQAQPLTLPQLPIPLTEHEALARLRALAAKNTNNISLIGMGYYGTHMPSVIQRNVLENPGWYTAYTPYQAEIAQGRLEALMNFQQMIIDLTGLAVANASLLDEATAAAEAMAMAKRVTKSSANAFFVDADCFPQTIDVLKTRAQYFGFDLIIAPASEAANAAGSVFGALLQSPNQRGECIDFSATIATLKAQECVCAISCDLLALMLTKSPAAMGADIALGSSQRFGIPMAAGGPHAAFFSCRSELIRALPGRLIGCSKDARGKPCLRMTLQTREQHIRREKANSNICTAQVLLANLAGLYAVYHGAVGLAAMAHRVHRLTGILAQGLQNAGVRVMTQTYFDTLHILSNATVPGYNLRQVSNDVLGLSLDETTTRADVAAILLALTGKPADIDALDAMAAENSPLKEARLLRHDAVLTHPVFQRYRTEHAILRYLRQLQGRDLALDHSMIPLGSCTMKLNAASAMLPITWPEFARVHPFAPISHMRGTQEMIAQLAAWLAAITGYPTICMQPNSGAQGEYAGIATIRRYQVAQGQGERDVCLIPKSAHGTNPATAQMCGLKVVSIACDAQGNVDVADLATQIAAHSDRISCLMITYPSTHGVFETRIREICAMVHEAGGQVYMDGANLNAQVGLTCPGLIGADVSHINLHKTFAIPHGGGGPGMGPIGLSAHLAPFAPGHVTQHTPRHSWQAAVSAAPWGSAGILPISWMYIAMLGGEGLTRATQTAILNANYIASRLKADYPVLYTGQNGRVAHECILDVRALKTTSGITEQDIAKRLMDYGFHAPTVSFPVAGTLMIEPTESENKAELDRFCEAMISIRAEISRIEANEWPRENNPLKNAPHTAADLADEEWARPYTRHSACFPLPWLIEHKFWPPVNRIDDVYGDRNLCCHLNPEV